MARTAYEADREIEEYLFVDCDLSLYSAAQVTDIVAADFIASAEDDAEFYLSLSLAEVRKLIGLED